MPAWLGPAIAAGGAVLGSLLEDEPDMPKPKILPKTVSGEQQTDFDILYDAESQLALANLADQLGEWAQTDRQFFTETFVPFQEQLIQTNQSLLPAIERTAGIAMEQIGKDLLSSEGLKNTFRQAAQAGGENILEIGNRFMGELDDLPTAEERVGQALAGTEMQFGRIGQQLKRDLAARGQAPSEATQRALAIEKAKTKSGVAGVAAEGARRERREALTQGLGVLSDVQKGQTGQLLSLSSQATQGLATPQVGGVTPITGQETTGTQAGIRGQMAGQQLGTRTRGQEIQFTQKGIKSAPVLDPNATEGFGQLANQPTTMTNKQRRRAFENRARRDTAGSIQRTGQVGGNL